MRILIIKIDISLLIQLNPQLFNAPNGIFIFVLVSTEKKLARFNSSRWWFSVAVRNLFSKNPHAVKCIGAVADSSSDF